MDVIGAVHDGNARVVFALVVLGQVAVVDLAVAVAVGQVDEAVAVVDVQVVAYIRARPAVLADGLRVLKAQHHGDVAAQHGAVGRDGAHGRAHRVQDAFGVVRDVVGHAPCST
ncbi:hypothetical protein G6F50_017229 [Rhizopus delemar]|uniref:Uncharacterized protein n=1 Tax=Rhizopus delemar TaxID=936053 RepID=A0A9P6XQW6_9FUNG|nr:hypothetical protein G6F50_017229 [Rhizopus delemar]